MKVEIKKLKLRGKCQAERESSKNKAVYTTASVAYGWAGAVTQVKLPFIVFSHSVTDGPTDRPTE